MKNIFGLLLLASALAACVSPDGHKQFVLQTTDGPAPVERVGIVLPHEHIFTDLRGPETPGYGEAEPNDVIRIMQPLLAEAKAQGVDLFVECTSIGVGRNVPIISRLARQSGLRIMVPTGVYGRAQFAPKAYAQMTPQE